MLPFYLIIALSKPTFFKILDNKLLAASKTWVFNSTRQTLSFLDVNNNFFSNSQHDTKQHIAVKSQCCISVHFSAKFITLYFIKIGHFNFFKRYSSSSLCTFHFLQYSCFQFQNGTQCQVKILNYRVHIVTLEP